MMDIELLAEAGALINGCPAQDVYEQLKSSEASGWLSTEEYQILSETYRLTWRLQSAARLLTGDKLDPDAIGMDGRAFLMRSTQTDSIEALASQIADACLAADQVITAALDRPAPRQS
jgi:glutamate-ammonia-ligase adenylyltransferase